jgi:hypothetical protein
MKKIHILLIVLLAFSGVATAGAGWATSVVSVSKDGGAAYLYRLNNEGWTDGGWKNNTDFNNYNLGTPNSLILNGGAGNAWADGGDYYDNTSFNIYYRVYKEGSTPGGWSNIGLTNQTYKTGNNYIYQKSDANIDVLALANIVGTHTYTFEVVMSKKQIYSGGTYTSMVPGGQGTGYDSNSAGYKAKFTRTNAPTLTLPSTALITYEMTLTSSTTGMDNPTVTYYVKSPIDKEFVQLANDKYTPVLPGNYQFKVIATKDGSSSEKTESIYVPYPDYIVRARVPYLVGNWENIRFYRWRKENGADVDMVFTKPIKYKDDGTNRYYVFHFEDIKDTEFQVIIADNADETWTGWNTYSLQTEDSPNVSDDAYFTVGESNNNNYGRRFVTKDAPWETFTWKGTTNTTWETAGNWIGGVVPNHVENIVYDASPTNDLVVPAGADKIKVVRNIKNESEKNLIIPANAHLVVTGAVLIGSNSTDPSKIVIEANSTDANGSLLFNPRRQDHTSLPKQTDVYATVGMYAKGFKGAENTWTDNISGSPTNSQTFTTSYHWQYFGVPVASVVANPAFSDAYLRKYREDFNGTVDGGKPSTFYAKWEDLNNESTLTAFNGYEITQDVAKKYAITGKLVYDNQTLSLTRKAPEVTNASGVNTRYGLGFNIFGNSYASAINIDAISFPEIVEKTVYLYNTGRFYDWTGGSIVSVDNQTSAGNYLSIPQNAASLIWNNQIPSMQGFLLKFTDAQMSYNLTGADVTLNYRYQNQKNQVIPNSKPQLVKGNDDSSSASAVGGLQITLESKSTVDNVWLLEREGTTEGFDNGWDGKKFFGTSTAFIFAPTSDGPMQVSTKNTIDGSVLSFVPNNDTDYILTLKKLNVDSYKSLHLIDLQNRTVTPLTQHVTSYRFRAKNNGMESHRFVIANRKDFDFLSDSYSLVEGYVNSSNELLTTNYTERDGTIRIFNLSGQQIMQRKLPVFESRLPLHLNSGIYLILLEADGHKKSDKFIIR